LALKGLSFSLRQGELLGFTGPNGAGRATTIKILSGILRPSAGKVLVNGSACWRHRRGVWTTQPIVVGLPVIEGLNLLRDIYRVEPAACLRTRDELVAMLRLERLLEQPVRQLSLGQRMRAEIDYRGGNYQDARISAETAFAKELVISDK